VALERGDGLSRGHGQDQRFRGAQAHNGGKDFLHHLRLHGDEDDLGIGDAGDGRIERHPMPGQQGLHLVGGKGIKDDDFFGIGTGFQPAFQHGAAHLAGAHENQISAERKAHASPMVSSRLLSRAASALWPAQQTYCTAG